MAVIDIFWRLLRLCWRVVKWFLITVFTLYAFLAFTYIFTKIELPYGYFLSPTYFEGTEWHHWFYNQSNMHLTNARGETIIPRPVIYVYWHKDYVFGEGFESPGGKNPHYFILSKAGEKWEFFKNRQFDAKKKELGIPIPTPDYTVWDMFEKRYTYNPATRFIRQLWMEDSYQKRVFPGLSQSNP